MDRVILHCDCNSFFASVETVLDPSLADGPAAVCGDPTSRHGIILAKNEAAKKFGVKTAETIWQAKRKCPNLRLTGTHHEEYKRFSALVNDIYKQYTDQVEPFGIDESWLDVTGSRTLFGSGEKIAAELRERVKRETGLTISVGVSFNKIFAKLGSDYKKPDATTVISRENWQKIIFPMPVGALLYVGNSAEQKLASVYIDTIGQLAAADRRQLVSLLGKLGGQLHDYANGIDDSPVKRVGERREIKSVGNGMTFRRDLTSTEDARVGIMALSDEVATRLRRYGMCCRTVHLQIRFSNMQTITRQRRLQNPTSIAAEIAACAMEILADDWRSRVPIRMLTVTGSALEEYDEAARQLSLFEESGVRHEKLKRLENAIDVVRAKYGRESIAQGSIISSDLKLFDESAQQEKGDED